MSPHIDITKKDPRYESLKSNAAIRLLSIKPGYPSETLECGLIVINNLDDAPPYEALSYVWGDEDFAEPIVCNGIATTVTANLGKALKHLRPLASWNYANTWDKNHRLHSSRNTWKGFATHRFEKYHAASPTESLIWIDALCINQDDLQERATQVKLMGRIYGRAEFVNIWLGEEGTQPVPQAPMAKKLLASKLTPRHYVGVYGNMPIVISFNAQALRNVDGARNPWINLTSADNADFRNQSFGFPPPSAPEWDIVRQFFAHPWFQRVWVVQEVVLARRYVALIGNWEIEWSALGQAAAWFQSNGYELPLRSEFRPSDEKDMLPVTNAASVWQMCEARHDGISLLDLLRELRDRSATKPADKLYATFGLAKEVQMSAEGKLNSLLEPDYTRPFMEVYRDASRYLIDEHKTLDVLSHAGSTGVSDDPKWPSWVPNWFEGKASTEFVSGHTKDLFRADAGEPLTTSDPLDKNMLTLTGIELDTVQSYGDRLASYGIGFRTYQEEREFVMAAWNIYSAQTAQQASPYSSKAEILRAFTMTLTAGLSNRSIPADQDPRYPNDAARWFSEHLKNRVPTTSWKQSLAWAALPKADPGRFHEAFVRACLDRRFFVTQGGYVGVGPKTIKDGDCIVVLFGGKVPYVLRRSGRRFRFIGDVYIPGLMEGQAVERWKETKTGAETFEIV